VINVIEDPRERADAVRAAFSLCKKVLAVAALIGGRSAYEKHRLFRDGVLTSRGTFQKYFQQGELKEYLEECLGREPVAVAPGVFFVFASDAEEQAFLAGRQSAWRSLPVSGLRPADRPRAVRVRRPSKWEEHRELTLRYWARCVTLGRMASADEFAEAEDLRANVGALKTVFGRLIDKHGAETLERAKAARMEDLQVYLSLNVFERRRSFQTLPVSLRRDLTDFWGTYAQAVERATALLYSVADPSIIGDACAKAADAQLGFLEPGHSLQVLSQVVQRLSPVLRVYVGCAARLYGDVESADLVKIHIGSGKLSVMTYDDFDSALPRLLERVKVNLRSQRIDFFDYDDAEEEQLLYLKSRFLPTDDPRRAKQQKFDQALERLGWFDFSEFGPPASAFRRRLAEGGLEVRGSQLRPKKA
jgi:DNA phosphorothioation-associated putative methyltransferase